MASHFLKVSEQHNIHYQIIGNDNDPPLILIHGGPGAGCTDNDLRFVTGLGVRAVLIDQRGCGRSTPAGSVIENTTQLLIDDIIAVMDHLEIKKAKILGGSWGSTLAIFFAIQHSNRVESLILRGLFMGTKKSRFVYEDPTSEAYKILKSYAHGKLEGHPWNYYYNMLCSEDVDKQKFFARRFAEYNLHKITEGKVTTLDDDIDIHHIIATNRIRLHYSVHDFFVADNYIWDRIDILQDIPITIVHGKYDEVCAPEEVEKFTALLAHTKVLWVEAGHSPKETTIVEGVRTAISNH